MHIPEGSIVSKMNQIHLYTFHPNTCPIGIHHRRHSWNTLPFSENTCCGTHWFCKYIYGPCIPLYCIPHRRRMMHIPEGSIASETHPNHRYTFRPNICQTRTRHGHRNFHTPSFSESICFLIHRFCKCTCGFCILLCCTPDPYCR